MTQQSSSGGVPDAVDASKRPPGEIARGVMRAVDRAALASAQRDAAGWPHPSLVLVATDYDGAPLLLISRLAEHTQNALVDGRVGLLFDGTAGLAEPLTGPRVAVLGRAAPSEDPAHRARFLGRHPTAAGYAGFGDFAVWRVVVERAHLVAGFGRIHWLPADAVMLAEDVWRTLAAREADVIAHMNADHADAVALYATVLCGRPPGDWTITGLDPDGCDLRAGSQWARLAFDAPVRDADAARVELVRLVKRARRALESAPREGQLLDQ